jgi:hypothetical protein
VRRQTSGTFRDRVLRRPVGRTIATTVIVGALAVASLGATSIVVGVDSTAFAVTPLGTTPNAVADERPATSSTASAPTAPTTETTTVPATPRVTGGGSVRSVTSTTRTPLTRSTLRSASAVQVFGAGPYLAPDSEAARAATALAASGDDAGATAARTIAQTPVAIWLGDWFTDTQRDAVIDDALRGAAATGTTPVFVTYAIPGRDCGSYSAGGLTTAGYEAWTAAVAHRLAGSNAVVIVEPDSLALLTDCPAEAATRLPLIRDAVESFADAGVAAYLDAGNSHWNPASVMAERLRAAGIDDARGFFTNVSNYYPTADEQAYAESLSALTGGAHYVIDTSRNGRGWRGTWCNGPGAGLGTAPRVAGPGDGALDAELWIKTPGASDGECGGAPAAGTWWSSYAEALVANRAR